MNDMRTLAFPQALGTGIVIQVRPQLSDSGETDNQHPNSPLQMTDSGESDIHAPDSTSCVTDSGEKDMRGAITALLDGYERALSRFREDSLVAAMRRAQHGGSFDFPDWAAGLFDLYDALHEASDGAIDPCVGEDLTRLGYGPAYTFVAQPDAGERVGAVHGRPTWCGSVERHGCTLVTRGSVSLDFGACGKGYAVDLIAALLRNGGRLPHDPFCDALDRQAADPVIDNADTHIAHDTHNACDGRDGNTSVGPASANPVSDTALVIDGGGDLLVHLEPSRRPAQACRVYATDEASPSPTAAPATSPLRIALEHPADPSQAVGVAEITSGALCASAPSRRHWGEQAGMRLHHLLNAVDGLPTNDVAAAWAYVREQDAMFPCATADGLATALFVTPPDQLRERFRFECAFIDADGKAHASRGFPATLFLA